MKKFICIIIVLLALASLTHCTVYEVETIEEIPCPGVVIDSIILSPWNPESSNPNNPSTGN